MRRRKFLLFSSLICTCRTLVPEAIVESYSADYVDALQSRLLQVKLSRPLFLNFYDLGYWSVSIIWWWKKNKRKLLFHNFFYLQSWRENVFGAPGRLVSHNRLHFHFIYFLYPLHQKTKKLANFRLEAKCVRFQPA